MSIETTLSPNPETVVTVKPIDDWLDRGDVHKLPEWIVLNVKSVFRKDHRSKKVRLFFESLERGWQTSVENTIAEWETIKRACGVRSLEELISRDILVSLDVRGNKVDIVKAAPVERR